MDKILYFCSKSPIFLERNNPLHVYVFKKVLEWAMTEGRWSGWVAKTS